MDNPADTLKRRLDEIWIRNLIDGCLRDGIRIGQDGERDRVAKLLDCLNYPELAAAVRAGELADSKLCRLPFGLRLRLWFWRRVRRALGD